MQAFDHYLTTKISILNYFATKQTAFLSPLETLLALCMDPSINNSDTIVEKSGGKSAARGGGLNPRPPEH